MTHQFISNHQQCKFVSLNPWSPPEFKAKPLESMKIFKLIKGIAFISTLISMASLSSCVKAPLTCMNADASDPTVGQEVTITSCTEDANGFIWEIPGNTTLISGGGACSESVVFFFNSSGTYTVYMTAINYIRNRGCNGTGAKTVSGNREFVEFNVN